MKKKSNKNHGVVAHPISEEERVPNIMQTAPNTEKPNHNHKFIWDSKKRRLRVDIKDTSMIPIRSEDISHS